MTADTEKKLPFMVAALLALGAWLACLTALFLNGLSRPEEANDR